MLIIGLTQETIVRFERLYGCLQWRRGGDTVYASYLRTKSSQGL